MRHVPYAESATATTTGSNNLNIDRPDDISPTMLVSNYKPAGAFAKLRGARHEQHGLQNCEAASNAPHENGKEFDPVWFDRWVVPMACVRLMAARQWSLTTPFQHGLRHQGARVHREARAHCRRDACPQHVPGHMSKRAGDCTEFMD